MSRRPLAAPVLAVLLLSRCASQAPLTLPAVGPVGAARVLPAAGENASMTGTLIVYSESIPVSKHRSSPSYPHTGYVIRRASGELVAQVDNHTSSAESEPEEETEGEPAVEILDDEDGPAEEEGVVVEAAEAIEPEAGSKAPPANPANPPKAEAKPEPAKPPIPPPIG